MKIFGRDVKEPKLDFPNEIEEFYDTAEEKRDNILMENNWSDNYD